VFVLVVFAWGIVQLFTLRFERGDVYPPYSTLRADPLGAKAFYDSLERQRNLRVSSNYKPLPRLSDSRETTLFLCGVGADGLSEVAEPEVKELEAFVTGGGRLVVTLHPLTAKPRERHFDDEKKDILAKKKKKGDAKKETKKKAPDEEDEEGIKFISLQKRWGFEFAYRQPSKDPEDEIAMATHDAEASLSEDEVSWHSVLYFDKLDHAWRSLYEIDDKAAIIERKLGRGTIVLAADSYFLSNEALRNEPHAPLLSWLIGSKRIVLFDETHLGVSESPGVAALARKYSLHWLLGGLLVLAGLFIWKNSVSFVPPYEDELDEFTRAQATGKDAAAGLVNMLRRSIPPSNVLLTCMEEWKKTFKHGRRQLGPDLARAEALVEAETAKPLHQRNVPACYQQISQILGERKQKWMRTSTV
jgi:hypothetical protein